MAIAKAAAATVLVAALLALALGEWAGWPFLAAPLAQQLSVLLDRHVQLGAGSARDAAPDAAPDVAPSTPFRVRFVGGLQVSTAQLVIASPAWSAAPR